jgi:hypothetical protein
MARFEAGSDAAGHWFDRAGFALDPARGRRHVRGPLSTSPPVRRTCHRREFNGRRYGFVIEHRFPDRDDYTEFMRGDYTRPT